MDSIGGGGGGGVLVFDMVLPWKANVEFDVDTSEMEEVCVVSGLDS